MRDNVEVTIDDKYRGLCLLAGHCSQQLFGDTYKSLLFTSGGLISELGLVAPAHVAGQPNRELWWPLDAPCALLRKAVVEQRLYELCQEAEF